MQCPKTKSIDLVDSVFSGKLPVKHCPDCKGSWISADDYRSWQSHQPIHQKQLTPSTLDVDYVRSPFDTKAALCPECGHYLARVKIATRNPFYVERCVNCGGIWCDYGEWEVLEQMGLNTTIEQLFTSEWQIRLREVEYAQREREATIDKLGKDLAQQVFALAEQLENHPNGDFGVAYLMRRFER